MEPPIPILTILTITFPVHLPLRTASNVFFICSNTLFTSDITFTSLSQIGLFDTFLKALLESRIEEPVRSPLNYVKRTFQELSSLAKTILNKFKFVLIHKREKFGLLKHVPNFYFQKSSIASLISPPSRINLQDAHENTATTELETLMQLPLSIMKPPTTFLYNKPANVNSLNIEAFNTATTLLINKKLDDVIFVI
ncbi:11369_t:CDS:2 [Diversispora eburnea]|uniref:11369_t:CDS:1 n=1 Tax=Diversispora eburnea TaxID=1213867 RepID=A0A9N8V0E5_9GLOM|nr:11369_t:CDS:2 [Diversispora eburnea]